MTAIDNNSPMITVRDVWEQLNTVGKDINTIKQNVSTIETKMDGMLEKSIDHEARLRTVEQLFAILNDVPGRLVKVERRIWSLPGAGTVISVIALGVAIWRAVK